MACRRYCNAAAGHPASLVTPQEAAMLHPLETLADVLLAILLWLMPIEEE